MKSLTTLINRSGNKCELCKSISNLDAYEIPHSENKNDNHILACQNCRKQLLNDQANDNNHWRCLVDSIWSPINSVQVISYCQLHKISHETWAQDCLNIIYLEDDIKSWADSIISTINSFTPTLDSNGEILKDGDNVILIKDLVVKGAGFTAKRGVTVKGISLTDNHNNIEGRINGTRIVLLSKFLKKQR